MTESISPNELRDLCRMGRSINLIDVRTPSEFENVHLEVAQNVPLDRLTPELARQMVGDSDAPLYFICQKGGRGRQACEKLAAAGFTNVVNIEGGTSACDAAGLPVVRGRKSMSLERQVRIAAGSLVVLASLLGFFVHPYWIGVSAFVGAGLIFAGVTDTCGMGMLLARLPWNQTGVNNNSCTSQLIK